MAKVQFRTYTETWLASRTLSTRTRDNYRRLLRLHLWPVFADNDLRDITEGAVHSWYAAVAPGTPTVQAHAYSLLRSIMKSALADGLIDVDPCQIGGVSTAHRAGQVRPATLAEIGAIADAMPEAYQALVLMAAGLAMPFSELGELRRKDIDLDCQVVHVRRAVELVRGTYRVTTPKSCHGIRDITIPTVLVSRIEAHLRVHVQPGRDALLFPSVRDSDRYLSPPFLNNMFRRACYAAGRADLRVPDLGRARASFE